MSIAAESQFRMLHTMVRVKDLDRSIAFYTGPLGMRLLRREDFPEGRFTLAFVGYGPEKSEAVVELTHNWDQETPYALGEGYGHIALGVRDIVTVCERLEQQGAKIPRKPRSDEARQHAYRVRRGSGRLQDRADRSRHHLDAIVPPRSLVPVS